MKCNSRIMLTTALALALAAVVVYFAFPAARAFIVGSAPVLIALACPVSMLLMMKAMNGNQKVPNTPTDERVAPAAGDLDSTAARRAPASQSG